MLIEYARVSKEDRNLDSQLLASKDAKCDQVFSDKKSDSQISRKRLEEALSHLRPDDTLVVWKLDRLGRTVKQVVDLITELNSKKINFKSLTDGIGTTTSAGRFFVYIMVSLVEMERELISERKKAGLATGKSLGRLGGRRREMTEGKVRSVKKLLRIRMAPRGVAKELGVSLATPYRWIPETATRGGA